MDPQERREFYRTELDKVAKDFPRKIKMTFDDQGYPVSFDTLGTGYLKIRQFIQSCYPDDGKEYAWTDYQFGNKSSIFRTQVNRNPSSSKRNKESKSV